jgi:hypothetical protein
MPSRNGHSAGLEATPDVLIHLAAETFPLVMETDSPRDPASPASGTGGAGFAFEDYVGAWFAAALLAGASPLGPQFGPIATIRFQAHQPLDDIVVTAASEPPLIWSASVKRFDMLRGRKLHDEFVQAAWRELTAGYADGDRRFVGFASGPVADGNWRSLQKLISAAEKDTPIGLATRIEKPGAFNATDRDIWKSALPDEGVLPREDLPAAAAQLFARLIPRRFDFEQVDSAAVVQANEWCRDAMAAGQEATLDDLWTAICRRVAAVRPTGGSLDWQSLLRALSQFVFAIRRDAAPDWQLLDQHTDSSLASVRDDLGGGLRLPRTEAWGEISRLHPEIPLGYLTGPSGCGKTALAKRWVQEPVARGLWLSALDLEDGLAAFRARLRLRLTLAEALDLTERRLRIVVDGLDRSIQGAQFGATAELARIAGRSAGRIQVLITAQQLALENVPRQLLERNAPRETRTVSIENFDQADIAAVLEARPQLRQLIYQGQLQSVLRRPKLLQVALDTLEATTSAPLGALRDETDVADLWWRHLARGAGQQTARGELLLGLASAQADHVIDATPAGDLGDLAPHADAVDALRRDGILEPDERRFVFTHDLFGDWSRYERLQGRDDALEVVAAKSTLPPWHHAIRLNALAVLQRDGVDAWRDQQAGLQTAGEQVASDLYLEAPLFASNTEAVLDELWPTLAADRGRLLTRFLGRFRHVATAPDPRGAEIFPDAPEIAAYWAATSRIPLIPLWGPVLRLLHKYASDAVDLAPEQIAGVTGLWLRVTPAEWPLRDEAADIALALAESLVSGALSEVYFHNDLESELWQAVLAAGGQTPEQTTRLCRLILKTDRDAREADDEDGLL